MACDENPTRIRGRVSRLNNYMVIVAVLWIATLMAILFEAQAYHARATRPESHKTEMAVLRGNRLALQTIPQ